MSMLHVFSLLLVHRTKISAPLEWYNSRLRRAPPKVCTCSLTPNIPFFRMLLLLHDCISLLLYAMGVAGFQKRSYGSFKGLSTRRARYDKIKNPAKACYTAYYCTINTTVVVVLYILSRSHSRQQTLADKSSFNRLGPADPRKSWPLVVIGVQWCSRKSPRKEDS